MIMEKYEKNLHMFKELCIKEKRYLSENRRLEILQYHWGIVGGDEKKFTQINGILRMRNSKVIFDEMMDYFTQKNYFPQLSKCGVYFVRGQHSPLVKIGASKNAPARLGHLQTGSPVRLWIDYVLPTPKNLIYEYEEKFHLWFTSVKEHGDWYKVPMEELRFIYTFMTYKDFDTLLETDSSRALGFIRGKESSTRDDEKDDPEAEVLYRQRMTEKGYDYYMKEKFQ